MLSTSSRNDVNRIRESNESRITSHVVLNGTHPHIHVILNGAQRSEESHTEYSVPGEEIPPYPRNDRHARNNNQTTPEMRLSKRTINFAQRSIRCPQIKARLITPHMIWPRTKGSCSNVRPLRNLRRRVPKDNRKFSRVDPPF